jgi:hypothetical protein
MMSTWSIDMTKDRIAAHFATASIEGQSLRDYIAPSLRSMAERQNYSLYHFQEAHRLLKEFQERHLKATPLMVVSHGKDPAKRDEFEVLMIQLGAHLVACVLSIHAIADVTAFAAYHSLGYGLRSDAIPNHKLSASNIRDRLMSDPSHVPIATLIDTLLQDKNYQHVVALANRSKHQALVRPMISEDWSGQRADRHEIRFAAFVKDGRQFEEVAVTTVLAPAHELASRTVVDVGNALLTALA